jgi:hypothetical protein
MKSKNGPSSLGRFLNKLLKRATFRSPRTFLSILFIKASFPALFLHKNNKCQRRQLSVGHDSVKKRQYGVEHKKEPGSLLTVGKDRPPLGEGKDGKIGKTKTKPGVVVGGAPQEKKAQQIGRKNQEGAGDKKLLRILPASLPGKAGMTVSLEKKNNQGAEEENERKIDEEKAVEKALGKGVHIGSVPDVLSPKEGDEEGIKKSPQAVKREPGRREKGQGKRRFPDERMAEAQPVVDVPGRGEKDGRKTP